LFSALRGGHASFIPNSFFQTAALMDQFSSSFLGALTPDQVSNIECGSLYGFAGLKYLNRNGSLQRLSPEQLSSIFSSSESFTCDIASSFSQSQQTYLHTQDCQSKDECKNLASCALYGGPKRSFDVDFSADQQNKICKISDDFRNFVWLNSQCQEQYTSSDSNNFTTRLILGLSLGSFTVMGTAMAGFFLRKQKKIPRVKDQEETNPLI
jgi:hypothetical protein